MKSQNHKLGEAEPKAFLAKRLPIPDHKATRNATVYKIHRIIVKSPRKLSSIFDFKLAVVSSVI